MQELLNVNAAGTYSDHSAKIDFTKVFCKDGRRMKLAGDYVH
jgi:hypothetical protein